jgi:hypothetical protein
MSLLIRFYISTAFGSVLLFVLLAIWGGINAVSNGGVSSNYSGALLISQVVLVVVWLAQIGLWLANYLTNRPVVSVIYGLLAAAALPCVRMYVHEHPPRRVAFSLALACLFVSGMALRALQTGFGP